MGRESSETLFEAVRSAYAKGDYSLAVRLWRPFAERDNALIAFAQYFLGVQYYEGRGVPQDYVLAHMWLNLAASHTGPLPVIASLVKSPDWTERAFRQEIVDYRNEVALKMTPAEISEAQRLARDMQSRTVAP